MSGPRGRRSPWPRHRVGGIARAFPTRRRGQTRALSRRKIDGGEPHAACGASTTTNHRLSQRRSSAASDTTVAVCDAEGRGRPQSGIVGMSAPSTHFCFTLVPLFWFFSGYISQRCWRRSERGSGYPLHGQTVRRTAGSIRGDLIARDEGAEESHLVFAPCEQHVGKMDCAAYTRTNHLAGARDLSENRDTRLSGGP